LSVAGIHGSRGTPRGRESKEKGATWLIGAGNPRHRPDFDSNGMEVTVHGRREEGWKGGREQRRGHEQKVEELEDEEEEQRAVWSSGGRATSKKKKGEVVRVDNKSKAPSGGPFMQ